MVSRNTILAITFLIPLIAGVTVVMPSQDGDGNGHYVYFDSQGGTPRMAVAYVSDGGSIFLDASAYKPNHILMGWSTEPNGEPVQWIKVYEDTTVYAVWVNEIGQDGYLQPVGHHASETHEYLTPVGYAIKYSPYALVGVTIALCQYVLYTRYQY